MPGSPGQPGAYDPERWDEQLAGAFAILLGRPLGDFDPKATYVLYHWDDVMSAEFCEYFEDPPLGSVAPPLPEAGDEPLSWGQWSFDLGRSVFRIDDVPDQAGAALRAISRDPSEVVVTGADLAPVAAEHEDLLGEAFLAVLARVDTDGTLFDAMRAATWTMGGPAGLTSPPARAVVEQEWQAALDRVTDPALRGHLQVLCLDAHWARSEGAYYSGTGQCPGDLHWLTQQPGYSFVTGWEFGEGQAASAIFAIS